MRKSKIQYKQITYRKPARKDYLAVAKQRRLSRKKIKTSPKNLPYINRKLAHIQQLIELGATRETLNKKQYKTLLVVAEVYRQQKRVS